MTTKPKPPFRRGEWVTEGELILVSQQTFRRAAVMIEDARCGSGYAIGGLDAAYYRRATARELRAESKRLTMRANQLSAAADAIKTARKRITEESSGTAKGKR